MSGYNLIGYLIFAFVTTITPGPNNYTLLSHGRAYGFKYSGRLMFGIALGFFVMLCISGFGIGGIIMKNATLGLILKIAGSAWLFYLAIVLSNLNADVSVKNNKRIGFVQGFLMQFVNIKAWMMAISGAAAFLPHLKNISLSVFVYATIFGLTGIPSMFTWVYMGDLISKFLKSEKANKIAGYVLFLLMMVCIVMIWLR